MSLFSVSSCFRRTTWLRSEGGYSLVPTWIVDVILLCFQLPQTYYLAEIRRWEGGYSLVPTWIVDVILLCFQLPQTYYLAEIRRGLQSSTNIDIRLMSLFSVSTCFRHTTWLRSEGGYSLVPTWIVDVILLCFQLPQTYYLAEIRRGLQSSTNMDIRLMSLFSVSTCFRHTTWLRSEGGYSLVPTWIVDVILLCFQLPQTYYLAEIRRGLQSSTNMDIRLMSLFSVSTCFRHTTWLRSEGGYSLVPTWIVDVILLCFQLLQTYYLAEIRRGLQSSTNMDIRLMSLFSVSTCFRHTTWLRSEGGYSLVQTWISS